MDPVAENALSHKGTAENTSGGNCGIDGMAGSVFIIMDKLSRGYWGRITSKGPVSIIEIKGGGNGD